MIAFVPVSRYKVDYQLAIGRPYSLFERLLLETVVAEQTSSLDNLQHTFRVHRRVVIEGLVTLMQAGWLALEQAGRGFVATAAGKQVVDRPGELPKNIVVSDRSSFLIGERVHGQLARGKEVAFTSKSELQPYWGSGVAIPKGAIPHPLEPGLVIPLLHREPGEWIRGCDAINVDRDGADFVVADVDTEKGIITGIPARWIDMLRDDLLERARRMERELTLSGKVPEDRALRRFVRQKTEPENGGLDPDEWAILLPPERMIIGSDDHHAILEDRLASARSYVAIVSGRIDGSTVERLEGPLRAAIGRGVLIDVLWGAAHESGDRTGLKLLQKIDWDSHHASGRGRLMLGKEPSRSHAKILVSDAGGEFEAIVGSYDWLVGDEASRCTDISLKLTEPGPVGRLCCLLADLAATDARLSKGAGIARLRNAAVSLDRRTVDDPDQQDSVAGPVRGRIHARLILGRRHHTVLGLLAKKARERLIVGTHKWGPYAEVGFRELEDALKNACPRVEVHYGVRTPVQGDEPLSADFEKLGGTLRHTSDLHAKFAVCDEDIAVVTSFNWLSPDLDSSQPSAGEIGFMLRGERVGTRLMERLGLVAAPVRSIPGAYVTRLLVTNLRSIDQFVWEVPLGRAAGWHVLVGDNGSGKSTVLRALALALVGVDQAAALRQNWGAWLRNAQSSAHVEVTVALEASGGHGPPTELLEVTWTKTEDGNVLLEPASDPPSARKVSGIFSAAYGPFRRFTGGDPELEKQLSAFPAMVRHLSMFDERVALTEGLAWLKDLHFGDLENDVGAAILLRRVTGLINESGLLPNDVKLMNVTRAAVVFADDQGHRFSVEDLSDGYRSVLSLTLDLLRQFAIFYGPAKVFDLSRPAIVIAPGVVLIDEVDAHLHPSWQRTIGQWFCDHFPRVQFIVASHSALVCQAAERGTVFHLPSPNDEEDQGHMLEGQELDRLVYGNVLEAYASGAFGDGIGRSESGKRMLRRLAELNQQELRTGLSDDERAEQQRLRGIFPVSPNVAMSREPTS